MESFRERTPHMAINPDLLSIARDRLLRKAAMEKGGFVPPADAAAAAPEADPMAGAMPPMPAMGGGAGGGGGDPMGGPPPEGGGGGGVTAAEVQAIVQQALAGAGGAGGAGGGEPIKPKIDVNIELLQLKNMMAKLLDAMGVQIPAQDMVATPEKLTAMAQGQQTGMGGAAPTSAIGPIEPMAGASPALAGGGGGGGGGGAGGGSKSAATERGREFPSDQVDDVFASSEPSKVATKAAAMAAKIRAVAKRNGHAVQGV